MPDLQTTRRNILISGGALFIGFALGERGAVAAAAGPQKPLALDQVDSFLAIGGDGRVTVFSGKVDLGTGVETALTQIAAEELCVPAQRVTLVQGDTALTPDQGPTWGSLSVQVGGMQIRQAAATARKALTEMAAQRLGKQPDELVVQDGVVKPRQGGNGIAYVALIGGRALSLTVDKAAPTKDPADFTIVGRPMPRLDIPAKVFGQFTYMQDFRVDGMLHGRVVRPAAIGATLESVDETSIHDIPGIVRVVRDENFLGVVAETEWAAIQGAQYLQAKWSDWQGLPDEGQLWDYVRSTKVVQDDVTSDKGDVGAALGDGNARVLRASYDFAIHTHGSIGPSCAIAEFKDGRLTCWTASQATHNLVKQLAAMLAMPVENIRAIYVEGSGCYGRNGHEDAAADATLLARAAGKPVRVQWSRQDEHGWDPKGPPTLVDFQAALDQSGKVTAWSGEFLIPQGAGTTVPLIAAELAALPHETSLAPGNITRDSNVPYDFPNVHTVCRRLESTPLRPSWIRTPGRMQNTFANESFMDELAAATRQDPLEFRLAYLKDKRGIELLHRLAEAAKWQTRPSPDSTQSGAVVKGRGLSYVKYELVRTYVGAVAEVEVDRSAGMIRVTRFHVAHDCGQIINPDGLRNQIEGCVIQTVSRTLKEEVKFNRSKVTSVDWATYPILTFPEVPEVEIVLIDRPREKPWGAGEPSAAVVPAAISNAVFDATGVRLRSVPFTPAKVKAAVQSI